MVKIWLRDGEDMKNALRRFRKVCEREGVVRDMKRCMYYESPGEKKRRAKMRSIANARREALERENPI